MKLPNTHNNFKTPKGYFDTLTDDILGKLAEESLPKKEGFALPDNYFNGLEKQILSKVTEVAEPKVIPLNSYKKYYYMAASIAAVIAVMIGLNWQSTAAAPTFEDLASADIENYFEEHDFDMSTYDIVEVLPVSDIEVHDFLPNYINNDNISNYIDSNIDDFDELNINNNDDY